MKSGTPRRQARPTRLNTLWRTVREALGAAVARINGTQVPRALIGSEHTRSRYNLEIEELPIRGGELSRSLLEMYRWCPEVSAGIDIITDDVLSNEDGSVTGCTIPEEMEDGSKTDAEVRKILLELIRRTLPGMALERYCRRLLVGGDAFASMGLAPDMSQINRLLFLPSFEVFRIESEQGDLLRFEQRKRLQDTEAIELHPIAVLHFRRNVGYLYGESLYQATIPDWEKLKKSADALHRAYLRTGNGLRKHITNAKTVPELQAYREEWEIRNEDAPATDAYLPLNWDLEILQANSQLSELLAVVQFWRSRIAQKLRVPGYHFTGLDQKGAREISNQPALSYARFINSIRLALSESLAQMFDTELALHGIPAARWVYRIQWPPIYTSPQAQAAAQEEEADSSKSESTQYTHTEPHPLVAKTFQLNGHR